MTCIRKLQIGIFLNLALAICSNYNTVIYIGLKPYDNNNIIITVILETTECNNMMTTKYAL